MVTARRIFGNNLEIGGVQYKPNSSSKHMRRLQLSAGFRYTPQSTKLHMRRLSVLLKRSAATIVVGVALVSSLITGLEAQDKKKPDWKDAAEYDLYKPITQTQDPKLWLDSLEKWTKQYPQSELGDIR